MNSQILSTPDPYSGAVDAYWNRTLDELVSVLKADLKGYLKVDGIQPRRLRVPSLSYTNTVPIKNLDVPSNDEKLVFVEKEKNKNADFPPNAKSIANGTEIGLNVLNLQNLRQSVAMWRHAKDVVGGPVHYGPENAQPDDVTQGHLGDCWLLSAMSVLACQPGMLERVFKGQRENMHYFRLCRRGSWKIVEIDDLLPCTATGSLVFAHSLRKDQLWVPMLEKAVARLYGSYASLNGGSVEEGLQLLTGEPCEVLWLRPGYGEVPRRNVWSRLKHAKENGYLIAASCYTRGSGLAFYRNGLFNGHAYAVLDVREESQKRLIRLRNPYGFGEWKGTWKDPDSDGDFWMPFNVFTRYFLTAAICRVKPKCREGRVKGSFNSDAIYILNIQSDKPQTVSVELFDYGHNGVFSRTDFDSATHLLLMIVDPVSNKMKYVQAFSSSVTVVISIHSPGKYLIIPYALEKFKKRNCSTYNLVVHSSGLYTLKRTTMTQEKREELLYQCH